MQLIKPLYVIVTAIALLASCSSDDEAGRDRVAMPVTLTIPVTDEGTPDAAKATRAGDPGTYEAFKLPTHAYIYIVCKNAAGKDVVVGTTPTLSDNWTKTRAESGDSVYQYQGRITVYLPIDRQATGKVYVALSTVELKGLPTNDEIYARTDLDETQVQNFRFEVNKEVRNELANIYSTPYNYRPDGVNYYGTMTDFNTLTPSLDIVLYHVAAKLDLLWNVAAASQQTKAVKSLTLELPTNTEAYIFKPLENTPGTATRDTTFTTNIGNQWNGRAYCYVIPMISTGDTYTFKTSIALADNSKRDTTVSAGIINRSSAFAPWMRGVITIR